MKFQQVVAENSPEYWAHNYDEAASKTDRPKYSKMFLANEIYYKVFKYNPHVMAISTLEDGRYLDVNDSFIRETGFCRDEVVGHTSVELNFWVDVKSRDKILHILKEKGHVKSFELEVRRPTGEIRKALLSAEVVVVDSLPCMLFSLTDVTEQKKAEESLVLSEERFRKIFYGSQNMIGLVRLSDRRYLDVNESWTRCTGYSRQEVVGKTEREINFYVDPFDANRMERLMCDLESIDHLEVQYRTKSGTIRIGLLSMEIMEVNKEQCLLAILTDITERKELEKEVHRLERLQLIGEMAAAIAHEIRNPLTTVRGFVQMFAHRNEYYEDRESLNLVLEELDRANVIINEYLLLAKDKAVDFEKMNLNQTICEIQPRLMVRACLENKAVVTELSEVRDMMADQEEIRQIILNLADNAFDAMSEGGQLTLRSYMVKEDVVLAVSDQGTGLRPEILERLGLPVFANNQPDPGWGLAVCFGIAMRHNAVINVETGPKGTTFFVRFKHKD